MRFAIIAAGLTAAVLMGGTARAAAADCDGLDRAVIFAGLDWDSNAFHNAVAGFILEHGYGCTVDQIPGTTLPLMNGMIRGDIDITMEMWIPNVREAWDTAVAGGDVAAAGIAYPDATQAWYVPKYLVEGDDAPAPGLKSVADLPRYAALFEDPEEPDKGRFYNCILGWSCEVMNSKKLIAYDLLESFTNFRPGTGGAMAAAIEASILRQRPIVFYYWSPTWLMGKVGDEVLKLEEPAFDRAAWDALNAMAVEDVTADTPATAWPATEVTIAVNAGFQKNAPTITAFLGRYGLSAVTISQALAHMQAESASAQDAAIWWLQNNDDWLEWVPDDAAARVGVALDGTRSQ